MKQINILITIGLCIMAHTLSAQLSYTLPSGIKNINIKDLNSVSIEGTTKAVAWVEVDAMRGERSERAKGLMLINGAGFTDNTKIGLNAEENGDEVIIRGMSQRSHRRYTFYVPADYLLTYNTTSNQAREVIVDDVDAELDISTLHNHIKMTDVRGPLAAHSVHGHIDVVFDRVNQSGPISVYSVHGHVDVSIPKDTKANLSLQSDHGEVYSDVDMKFEKSESGLKRINNRHVRATVNGGGVKMGIKSDHGDVYLRNL